MNWDFNKRRENGGEKMEFSHVPVLLEECIQGLAIRPSGIYVDGTAGGAGHSLSLIHISFDPDSAQLL